MTDADYMRLALRLAERGRYTSRPNPMVGAIAVREGRIVGQGWHPAPGQPHAEVFALEGIDDGAGVTLYVTLEPCAFEGRTPACSALVAGLGIDRLVSAMEDPDPRVSGAGFQQVRSSGARVEVGVLEDEARRLNAAYVKHRTTGRPLVTLKIAQTLDGNIATSGGDSKWITGTAARARGHALRAEAQAVIVGRGTVAADDPALTVRHVAGMDPVKVVLDSRLVTRPVAKVFDGTELILVGHLGAPHVPDLEAAGATVWRLPGEGGRPSLAALLDRLGEREFIHVLVEGGGEVAGAFLASGLVDRVAVFIAPKLAGNGTRSIDGLGLARIADSVKLTHTVFESVGEDFLLTADVDAKR